jgi:hypothetical protein
MALYERLEVGELVRGGRGAPVSVLERNELNLITICMAATADIPSTASGYAVGCKLIDSDTGQIYTNIGSATSCTFTVAGLVGQLVSQDLKIADFTDNTNATGYIDITDKLPAGAIVLGWKAVVGTGFSGDTTAVIEIGVSGTLDKFSVDTSQSVLTAGTVGSSSKLSANNFLGSATTVRVTVTGGADFTSITAGEMVVTIYYVQTA